MSTTLAQTVARNNTPHVRFNWGFNDGCFGAEQGLIDRSTIPSGETFQLRYDNDTNRAYSAGYKAGFAFITNGGDRSEISKAACLEALQAIEPRLKEE